MKVREVIEIKGWVDGLGWCYNQVIEDNIIEIDKLPEDFSDFDNDFLNGFTHNGTEDTKVTASYYAVDDTDRETPLAHFSEWASDLDTNSTIAE